VRAPALVITPRPIPQKNTGETSNVLKFQDKGKAFVETHGSFQTILLVIGFVTVLAVFGALFIAAGTEPDKIATDAEVAPVDSALFANSLSHLVNAPLEKGGTVTILNNGDEFLPALIDAIDTARKTINFSVYIWNNGSFSDQVLAALLRAQSRNVEVRLLLDDFGSKDASFGKFDELKRAGAKVEKFRKPQFGKWTRLPGVERFIHLVNSPAADSYAMAEFYLLPIFARRGFRLASPRLRQQPRKP
jgi:phosphatidylserine/phosphatidylglycerophosphate/cardiolipin synthase-like enzyme